MRDAGYRYINIDDTWEGTRDASGAIHPNSKFPDMKALADYVHSKGLKLGLYSSPGPKTCAGFEGSYGHEEQDARTYAAWGIDYLKYDLCSLSVPMIAAGSQDKAQEIQLAAYRKMDAALKATGRPMVYSLCQYGFYQPWRWAPRWAATAGAPPATSRTSFRACCRSASARPAWRNSPAPVTGTTPTCWRSATAACRVPNTAPT